MCELTGRLTHCRMQDRIYQKERADSLRHECTRITNPLGIDRRRAKMVDRPLEHEQQAVPRHNRPRDLRKLVWDNPPHRKFTRCSQAGCNSGIDVAPADIAKCCNHYHDRQAMRKCNPW
jgi:hypothetical protein